MTTLKDIAKAVGVHTTTVSSVLNHKKTKIAVSQRTQTRIFNAARELNYVPNANARALVTGRSGNLGFILSDQITGGWGNAYFATQLMGVEERCRELGYGLSISRYNLSNVKDFVFPTKMQRRNVDGLVLAGRIALPVLEKLQAFGVPCVAIGMSGVAHEVADRIPTISANEVAETSAAFEYLYGLGHHRIGFCIAPLDSWRQMAQQAQHRARKVLGVDDLEVKVFESERQSDWIDGERAFDRWAALPQSSRPTAMFGSDQAIIGFLKAMKAEGYQCSRDISLVSGVNSQICNYVDPPLTAMTVDQLPFGRIAVDLLVDHLDHGQTLEPQQSILEPRFSMVHRHSCRDLRKLMFQDGKE